MDASSRLGLRCQPPNTVKKMLEKEYRKLLRLRASLEDAVNDLLAADPSKVISRGVNLWLEQVEAAVTQVEDELKHKSKAEIGTGSEEELYKMMGFMRDDNNSEGTIVRLRAEITRLRQNGKDLMSATGILVVMRSPERIHNLPGSLVDHPVGVQNNILKVLEYLQDDDSLCIGIYGMGGVGKTTLVKEIVERLKSQDLPVKFDFVLSVVVSQQPNILKIQDDIGVQLGFSRDGDQNGVCLPKNMDDRAKKLSELLSTKKFMLVLDDVWKKIELADIGVPSLRERNPKSKIVLTTRKEHVCRDMQCGNRTLLVRPLDEKHSWDLFCDHIPDAEQLFRSSEAILSIAKDVIKRCGGLPLAIKILARAMGDRKHVSEWKAAKSKMDHCSPGDVVRNQEEEVYEILKFSFDNLPKEMQSCFLFCALYLEDQSISIPELVNYFIGEGLHEYTNLSDFEQLEAWGRDIIADLKGACLLENGVEYDSVKMNDAVRDMAIWLGKGGGGYDGCKFFTEILSGEQGMVDKKWRDVRRIMLRHNVVFEEVKLVVAEEEEEEQMSPSHSIPLKTFIVRGPSRVINVPESFFRLTTDLRVLVMSGAEATYEPMYVFDLPMSLFELTSLRHLDLSCLDIREVPVELGRLVNLVVLDLSGNGSVQSIPSAAFYPLKKLHVLNLKQTPCFKRKEDNGLTVWDLKNMSKLKFVSLHFEQEEDAGNLVHDEALTEICIRSLGIREINDGLTTDDLRKIASSHSENMEELCVYSCRGIDGTFRIDDCCQNLVSLLLQDIPLTAIEALTQCRSLEQLSIISCHQLMNFPCLSNFPNLRSLSLMYCWKLVALGPMEEEAASPSCDGETPTLPKLEEIVLIELLEMRSISSTYLRFPSLHELRVERCPELKKLAIIPPDSNVMMKCDSEWWESVVWEDQSTQGRFAPVFEQDEH